MLGGLYNLQLAIALINKHTIRLRGMNIGSGKITGRKIQRFKFRDRLPSSPAH